MKLDDLAQQALQSRIHPEHEAIHERLKNWAAWSQDRIRQGKCGSIENRWKSPQIWNPPEPRTEWNTPDAADLYAMVCKVPENPWRWCLHMRYVYHMDYGDIRKALAIPRKTQVEDVLHKARAMLKNICRRG